MQHSETDASPIGPHWGEKEQIASVPIPLMTGIAPSQYPKILASEGNPALYVQADGRNNISSVLIGKKPWSGLGLDSLGPVLEILDSRRRLCNTLRLMLVPLAHTGVRRNKLCPRLSH